MASDFFGSLLTDVQTGLGNIAQNASSLTQSILSNTMNGHSQPTTTSPQGQAQPTSLASWVTPSHMLLIGGAIVGVILLVALTRKG